MTSRLLLTLLALLTGLSAQGSAVHARPAAVHATQIAAVCALTTVRRAQATAGLSQFVAAPLGRLDQLAQPDKMYRLAIPAPAVLTGIDRARE